MFNKDFFPTPVPVIETMLSGIEIRGKVYLEPSAGKGDIVDYLNEKGAKKVVTCELNKDLAKIVATKSTFLKNDFLDVDKTEVSFVDVIVMNPPFSADEKHILHAWEIAPAGCIISALCNYETLNNPFSKDRKILVQIIQDYGFSQNLGDVFSTSERKTGINIGLIRIQKPGKNAGNEFDGYFDTEYVEEEQGDGIIRYNEVRDCVNRYVAAVKLYDSVLLNAVQMNMLLSKFGSSSLVFTVTENGKEKSRENFKNELQKSAWKYIFNKMNLGKYTTTGVMSDINKFVEQQQKIPFTVNNVYKMLEIIVGTRESRMNQALEEVFNKVTERYSENRYQLEGWKTNSYYLVNRKFIYGGFGGDDARWPSAKIQTNSNYASNLMDDFNKALCFLTGTNYDTIRPFYLLDRSPDNRAYGIKMPPIVVKGKATAEGVPLWGEKFEWGFFEVVLYKKGSGHFTFLDEKVWAMFNQRIAKIKGYPLPEKPKERPKPYNPEPPKAAPATPPKYAEAPPHKASVDGIVVTFNPKKKGIEISFSRNLTFEELRFLKANGFDYSASSKFWYTAYTASLLGTVKQFFKVP